MADLEGEGKKERKKGENSEEVGISLVVTVSRSTPNDDTWFVNDNPNLLEGQPGVITPSSARSKVG